eukprot:jgi/Tetstr1/422092/TSEL_012950.t1
MTVTSLQAISARAVSDHLPLAAKGRGRELGLLPLVLLKQLLARTLTHGAPGTDAGGRVFRAATRRYSQGQWLAAWGDLLAALSASSPGFCASLSIARAPALNPSLFPCLLNLRALTLTSQACTDRVLYSLAKLGNLEALAVRDTPVTATGLKLLAAGRPGETLQALDVGECSGVTDDAAPHILQLSALSWLNVSGCGLTEEGLLRVAGGCCSGAGAAGRRQALRYLSAKGIPMSRAATRVTTLLQLDRDGYRALQALAQGMRGRQDVLDTFRGDLARTLLPPGQPFPDMTAAVVSEAAAAAAAPPPSQLARESHCVLLLELTGSIAAAVIAIAIATALIIIAIVVLILSVIAITIVVRILILSAIILVSVGVILSVIATTIVVLFLSVIATTIVSLVRILILNAIILVSVGVIGGINDKNDNTAIK